MRTQDAGVRAPQRCRGCGSMYVGLLCSTCGRCPVVFPELVMSGRALVDRETWVKNVFVIPEPPEGLLEREEHLLLFGTGTERPTGYTTIAEIKDIKVGELKR